MNIDQNGFSEGWRSFRARAAFQGTIESARLLCKIGLLGAAISVAGCGGGDRAVVAGADTTAVSRALAAGRMSTAETLAGSEAGAETSYSEAGKLIRGDESLTALGNEMFGDRVALYNGALEFVQSDVSVPGNSAVPVSVARRHTAPVTLNGGRGGITAGHFGDWELEIPHLHGVFASPGWVV